MLEPQDAGFFDLDAYAGVIRRYRRNIALLVVAAGLVGAAVYAQFGKHRAEGMYTVGSLSLDEKKVPPIEYERGIPPYDYKTLSPRFAPNAFEVYLANVRDVDPEAAQRVRQALSIESRRRDLLAPVYGTTRSDLRELGEGTKAQENAVLGMRIGYASRDREVALRVVRLAGEFVGDTVFRSSLRDLLLLRARDSDSRRLIAENTLIKAKFDVGQLEQKGRELARLRTEFPELVRGVPQQVISVVEGGQRYLSPSAQVVGVESTIAEYRERIGVAERNMRKNDALRRHYQYVLDILERPVEAKVLMTALQQQVPVSFPAGNDPDGAIAEARNEALIELGALMVLRTRGLQFVVEPAIAEREPFEIVAMGFASAAAALGAALLFLLARVWWRSRHRG